MLKVLIDENGKKTVLRQTNPPLQVRTGLLPQDMLVPSGLILPENLKGIIGNLKIDAKSEDLIKVNTKESFEEFLEENSALDKQTIVPILKEKTLFVKMDELLMKQETFLGQQKEVESMVASLEGAQKEYKNQLAAAKKQADAYKKAIKEQEEIIRREQEEANKPEPAPPTDDSAVWDELDAAYQAGYNEGYTEGVNGAYDQ